MAVPQPCVALLKAVTQRPKQSAHTHSVALARCAVHFFKSASGQTALPRGVECAGHLQHVCLAELTVRDVDFSDMWNKLAAFVV